MAATIRNVHRLAVRRSHVLDRPLLQHTEQLPLEIERKVADFVQEQGASVSSSNRPCRKVTAPVNAPR